MFCIGSWLLPLLFYSRISPTTPARPIDIVTEKIQGKWKLSRPPIIPMIPDQEPLFRRQYWTTRRRTTIPYQLYLKYHGSRYVKDYDVPFIAPVENKGKPISSAHGQRIFSGQMMPLFGQMLFGLAHKPPSTRGTFKPPDLIHIPNWNWRYSHVNFYYNRLDRPSLVQG